MVKQFLRVLDFWVEFCELGADHYAEVIEAALDNLLSPLEIPFAFLYGADPRKQAFATDRVEARRKRVALGD